MCVKEGQTERTGEAEKGFLSHVFAPRTAENDMGAALSD